MSYDLVEKLISCYPKPPEAMISEMERIARSISEDNRQRVFDAILDEAKASMRIGVKDIKDACRRIGVSFTQAIHVTATPWTCDCCGTQYKYHPEPSYDDEIDRDIHDRCPECGFQRCWTIAHRQYVELGHTPEWYMNYIKIYSQGNYGTHKANGPWFSKGKRIKERYKQDAEDRKAREELEAGIRAIRKQMSA